jgi:hypothetical protein
MPKLNLTGAIALVAAPALALVGVAVTPTMSDHAANQVQALTVNRSAMILGLTLQTLAVVLLIAGTIWLALAIRSGAPKLAVAGGILAVGGSLVVLFENGAAAAAAAIVGHLDPAAATAAVGQIHSGALAGLEPVSILGDIGLAILGYSAVKAGAARWTGVAIPVGALAVGLGFATGTKPVLLIAFAILLIGVAGAAANLVGRPAQLRRSDEMVVAAG